MMLIAGTTQGVFTLDDHGPSQVLEAADVRDLQMIDGRVFAGSASGLFVSDDGGRSWRGPQLEGYEVWQIRAATNGSIYVGTQPAGLFRSDDGGHRWTEIESFS